MGVGGLGRSASDLRGKDLQVRLRVHCTIDIVQCVISPSPQVVIVTISSDLSSLRLQGRGELSEFWANSYYLHTQTFLSSLRSLPCAVLLKRLHGKVLGMFVNFQFRVLTGLEKRSTQQPQTVPRVNPLPTVL